MAADGNAGDFEDEVARWTRVGEVGMEAGLREIGCTEKAIAKSLRSLRTSEFRLSSRSLEDILKMLRTEKSKDAPAVFLATLGRRSSSHVKEIRVTHTEITNESQAIALIVNLTTNTSIEDLTIHNLHGLLRTLIPLLATAFKGNSTLQRLSMGWCLESKDVSCLLEGFKANEALQLAHLDFSYRHIRDEGVMAVADFLTTNVTLKTLTLISVGCGLEGANHIAAALEQNSTLEELYFGENPLTTNGMKRLLEPLSGNPGEAGTPSKGPKNTTLTALQLESTAQLQFCAESVALMIKTNRCLRELDLSRVSFFQEDWTKHIFPSLQENHTLETLDLYGCHGLTEDAHQVLLDALKFSATVLTKIDLTSTTLESKQGSVDEELRINKAYRSRLRSQPQVPTTSGRLVLCGYQFAGKTAIRKTIERIAHGSAGDNQLCVVWKKVMRASPRLRSLMFGRDAHRELATRTRGFDILAIRNQSHLAAVWDFAGQREYYALHDYLFPNLMNSCFLYVCSPWYPPDIQNSHRVLKSLTAMREECEYWLRFIASNSKPVQNRRELPRVRFVLSHKDTLNSATLSTSRQHAEEVVLGLKDTFHDVIDLCESVEVVDANSTQDVKRLIDLTNLTLQEVLEHQTEYDVCKVIGSALKSLSRQYPSRLAMSLEEFEDVCREEVRRLTLKASPEVNLFSSESRRAILAYLNDIGEIIFPVRLDFIVLDPRWFGVGVLGSLIDAFGVVGSDCDHSRVSTCTSVFCHPKTFWKLHHKEGFVERRNIQGLLEHSLQMTSLKQNISSDQLIQLLIHLELGFETMPGHADSSLFIPTLFDDENESAAKGTRKLEWKLARSERAQTLLYLGRRLECEKKSTTCLTPGFFPRFQVVLYNYIHQRGWTGNPGFEVGRNSLCFAENGVEVLVEYSGDIGYFVDILVRSSKPYAEALKFIEEHVVKTILQFCASPQGCQGVQLVEAVIRPECVRCLHLCLERKDHSVPISVLKTRLAQDQGYEYFWSHKLADVRDSNFATDLLEGQEVHNGIGSQPGHQGEHFGSMASSSNQGQHYFSIVQQQLPRLFFPSIEDVGWLRKLDQMLNVAKVMPIKLHLMCDHKDGSHKVEGQTGRTMKLSLKEDSFDLPLAKLAVTLLWTGASAGKTIAGAGGSLPVVDRWIQSMFDVPYMPAISGETLQQLMKQGESSGERGLPISEQAILKALERYMQVDPYTEGIKKILNLQDGDKFWKDFRLRKVIYTDGAHPANKVWWVCKHHYELGLRQRIVQSVPYSLHH